MGRKTNTDAIIDDGSDPVDTGPSKSERKRVATAAQKLGERLVALRESEFIKLDLPERLADAIRAARTMRGHGALARQRQYIGKLMREVDPEPILTVLDAASKGQSLDAERFKRAEKWRDRLIAEGEPACVALEQWRKLTDAQRSQLRAAVERSRRPSAATDDSARLLFRLVRELV